MKAYGAHGSTDDTGFVENPDSWFEYNQSMLSAHLAHVRSRLHQYVNRLASTPAPDFEDILEGRDLSLRADGRSDFQLERLSETFRLSSFERNILLLCAGIEFDSEFAALCAAAHGNSIQSYPTFGLALALFPDGHWSALSPTAPLRYWRLIHVGAGPGLTRNPLQIDEPILHFLAGIHHLDERLVDLVTPVQAMENLVPSHLNRVEEIVTSWAHHPPDRAAPVILLFGDDKSCKHSIAATACAALRLNLSVIAANVLPAQPSEIGQLVRLWERESALNGRVLLIECDEMDPQTDPRAASITRLIEHTRGPVFLSHREQWLPLQRQAVLLDIKKPSLDEQSTLWQQAFGEDQIENRTGDIDRLVSQFNLSARTIHSATITATYQFEKSTGDGSLPFEHFVWDACRRQARPRLDDLATRIEPASFWQDLILPETQTRVMREAATHVRQRLKVYHNWDFVSKSTRGLGISALFAGTSGTGKTMAAEVLANELQLDLYRIDLSQVVSKYIGETEKNLRRIFDAADEGGVILLFDEADALFGKRSDVKDSHDRYANIEVSYLLQRMEAYRGLAILTTNMKGALDVAFMRRIRFIIHFPFPDVTQRAEIWRRIFPTATPTLDLDLQRLARLSVAGGNIRNIAMNAAFLAAEAGEPVRMHHLLDAARSEYQKLGKTLTDSEIEGWDDNPTPP